MKRTLAALALIFTVGTAHAATNPTPTTTKTVVTNETPKCVEATQRLGMAYAIVTHSMAFVIAQAGGGEDVEKKLTTVESQLATIAIRELYQFAKGESKCWSLTRAQTLSILKAVGVMMEYINEHKLEQQFGQIVSNNLPPEAVKSVFNDATQMSRTLAKHAGLKTDGAVKN